MSVLLWSPAQQMKQRHGLSTAAALCSTMLTLSMTWWLLLCLDLGFANTCC